MKQLHSTPVSFAQHPVKTIRFRFGIICMMLVCFSLQLSAQKIGVNKNAPAYPVSIQQPEGMEIGNFEPVLDVEYTGDNSDNVIAVRGISLPTPDHGVGGSFEGGAIGGLFRSATYGLHVTKIAPKGGNGIYVQSIGGEAGTFNGIIAQAHGSGNTTSRAVFGQSFASTGTNFGVYGYASLGTTNYGIYGRAIGNGTNWAGYFDDGNVYIKNRLGIGQINPLHPVHINQPEGTTLNTGQPVMYVEYTGTTEVDAYAIRVKSRPADFFGIGGEFEGGYIGARGVVYATGSNSYYGVQGEALNGAGENIGIYGNAAGGQTNWAGFFSNGNVKIINRLVIGAQATAVYPLNIQANQAVTSMTSTTAANGSVLVLRNNTESPAFLGAINFVNSSGGTPGQIGYSGDNEMSFRTNNAERMRINSTGLTGIGRTPTTNRLEVEGNASKSTAGDWLANSDARLKKNIQSLDSREMLDKLLSLRGITYEWNDDKTGSDRPEGVHYGFTAQNIQEVFPTLVEEDALGYLQTAYSTYDAMIVEALRALNEKIENLQKENAALRTELQSMQVVVRGISVVPGTMEE